MEGTKCLVAIDIGTTGAKAVVFGAEEKAVASGYREYACAYPRPNWVEQDAAMLAASSMESCSEAMRMSGVDPSEVGEISRAVAEKTGLAAAINFREPDRIPIDMWGTDSRLIDEFYFKVIEYLGWDECGGLERPGKTAQYVNYDLSDRFDCDFRHIVAKRPRGWKY